MAVDPKPRSAIVPATDAPAWSIQGASAATVRIGEYELVVPIAYEVTPDTDGALAVSWRLTGRRVRPTRFAMPDAALIFGAALMDLLASAEPVV